MTSQAIAFLNSYMLPLAIALAFIVVVGVIRNRAAGREGSNELPPPAPLGRSAPEPAAAAARPAVPPQFVPPPAVPPAPAHTSVLAVDDSAVVRAKLRKLFEGAGWQVTLAKDGHEAMSILASQSFSVLVTDLEMPGMDGFELIAAVQGAIETENLPIIAITGHEELQTRVHAMQGLYGLFRKPWNDRELLRRVETLALLRAPAREGAAAEAPAA